MSNNQVNLNTANFYIPVSNLDFNEIYQHIKTHKTTVSYKILDQHAKSVFLPSENDKICISKTFPENCVNKEIICCFDYNGETHLFKSFATNGETNYVVDRPTEIFKMQRRENFRVSIPATVKHNFKINDVSILNCTLRNISLGGCRISIASAFPLEFKVGTELKCTMTLLDNDPFIIETEVVFAEFNIENKTQIYGLKFLDLDSEATTDLQTTLVHIDRITRGKKID